MKQLLVGAPVSAALYMICYFVGLYVMGPSDVCGLAYAIFGGCLIVVTLFGGLALLTIVWGIGDAIISAFKAEGA